ncbi:MAG TPA: ISL3 family transposase [Acidimicrobiales bacterium]|nr:ISL3 family transposase [Acidimicrobiales bacterium]
MSDGTGLAEALLGLDGFRVLAVTETPAEVVIEIETTATVAGCPACGTRAVAHERMPVEIRDLACFGRPARLVWRKRRWRCVDGDCEAKTFTETSPECSARALLTRRAAAEACRQVGENARPVAELAEELGVCWWTVMAAVIEHGTPLVEDPDRVGATRQLGIDETSWLAANRRHPTLYATGLVDLDAGIVIDLVEGNSAHDLRGWLADQDQGWLAGIEVVTTDLAESYRAGLDPHLAHATRVADPFHVVRVANRCVDKVRRRVQNETLHHRGRKHDPLYRIRKLLLAGAERLDRRGQDRMLLGLRVGDPHDEVLGAWLAKESARDIYLTDDPDEAALLIDKAIAGCAADDVEEIGSLGRTLSSWRTEILEHHKTGASNGPTEGLNLCVKKVKRCGHGLRRFEHYRLRVLLHAGGVTWPCRPSPPRIRTRAPYSDA